MKRIAHCACVAPVFNRSFNGLQPPATLISTGSCVRGTDQLASRARRAAFTLTEMVIVIGIIILLLAATIPGLSSLWQERRQSEVVTTLSGALANARAQALNGRDHGLFFCVVDGIQKAFPIERFDELDNDEGAAPSAQAVVNRFRIAPGNIITFPESLRVAPRNVLDSVSSSWLEWDDTELLNPDFQYRIGVDEPQRQRNFFTMIFRSDGRQEIGRNVVIYDCDACDPPYTGNDGMGDVTGLAVGKADKFDDYSVNGVNADQNFDAAGTSLEDLIVDDSGSEAINFVSVDSLLVYDEKEFADPVYVTAADKRATLKNKGQPLYVSRNTGKVIVGPVSEN